MAELTLALVYAASTDAGNRVKKKEGLPYWSDAAWSAARSEFDRLGPKIADPHGRFIATGNYTSPKEQTQCPN